MSGITAAPDSKTDLMKEMVRELLKSLETGDPKPFGYINPKKYIQHNLAAEDGPEGLQKFMSRLPKGSVKVHTVRLIADGDFVAAHSVYDLFGPRAGFDIFRFENGKIVEHWDNLAAMAAKPNPSGRTQIDGPEEVADRGRTQANKKLVEDFVSTVLVRRQYDRAAEYLSADNYRQHNTMIGDNLSGLNDALGALAKQGIAMGYDRVHRVLGEGNFVLTVSEGAFGGKHAAYYDLFRVENGRIVEHWDVLETIPETSRWKNRNGKF